MEQTRSKQLRERIIVSMAQNGMKLGRVADQLGYRRSSIAYQVDQIKETTGKDPRDFYDLVELLGMDVDKYGRWMPKIIHGERFWECSECRTLGSPTWKRCPICEAKMEGML